MEDLRERVKKAAKRSGISANSGSKGGHVAADSTFDTLPLHEQSHAAPLARLSQEALAIETRHQGGGSARSDYDDLGELPEAYGTGRVFLAARDPKCLFAYWDFTWHQLQELTQKARYGELKLRIYRETLSNGHVEEVFECEMSVSPGARNWFVEIPFSDHVYKAEFGYYDWNGCFCTVSVSGRTRSPKDYVSSNTQARFVTLPFRFSFQELFSLLRSYFQDGEELLDVLVRLQLAGMRFPFDYDRDGKDGEGIRAQLAGMFGEDLCRRVRMGSEELTEILRRRMMQDTSSGLLGGISSGLVAGSAWNMPAPGRFWLKVNAELIVYGATDPRARVMFDGKPIELSPDGTFRFQFALPDGAYSTPILADSPEGNDRREVHLHFLRESRATGDVGSVEPPANLGPPPADRGLNGAESRK
jgi:uncharacterized protein